MREPSNTTMGLFCTLLLLGSASAWRWTASPRRGGRSTRRLTVVAKSPPLPSHQVILIDGDNVRGKTGFSWSNAHLVDLLSAHRRGAQPPTSPLVVFDHGLESDAHWSDGVGVLFAGAHRSADDALVSTVGWFSARGAGVTVYTSDSELHARCRRAGSTTRSVRVFESSVLIEQLILHDASAAAVSAATSARVVRRRGRGGRSTSSYLAPPSTPLALLAATTATTATTATNIATEPATTMTAAAALGHAALALDRYARHRRSSVDDGDTTGGGGGGAVEARLIAEAAHELEQSRRAARKARQTALLSSFS